MYIKPICQNTACFYHKNPDSSMIIKKGKDPRAKKPVQRYQCKACGSQFSTSTLIAKTFHRPEILPEIFLRYTSGYSISRLAEELNLHKETVLKAIEFLGEKCRVYHNNLLDTGFLMTDKIFFDEMESYVHSKVYPVSLGLAVDVLYKRIVDIRVAEMKLKGALKKKVMRDCGGALPPKIANRPNNTPVMLDNLMKSMRKSLRLGGTLYSDEKRYYKTIVKTHFPNRFLYLPEKSRTSIHDHRDPQALGRFNSVCIYLRTYVSSLGRRKLITAKSIKSLEHHLHMAIARYNKYDLQEILNHGIIKEDFYEREWRVRKETKMAKNVSPILVAHLWRQKQTELVNFLAWVLYIRDKTQSVPKVA